MLGITGAMKHFRCLSKVKQAQLGCSSLMFAIALLCSKRDRSVRCAAASGHVVVTILFFQIATDDYIGITIPDSARELPAGFRPTRFEDDT
jgi:hypothetical protein